MQDHPIWYPYDHTGTASSPGVRSPTPGGNWPDPYRPWDRHTRGLVVASFGRRAGALVIDGCIILVLQIAGFAAMWSGTPLAEPVVTGWMVVGTVLTLWGLPLLYGVIGVGVFGRTIGKAAVGLRVTRPDGTTPIGVPRALGRSFARIVSALPLYIGYLMPLWDREGRALHDIIVDTRVAVAPASTLERSRLSWLSVALQSTLLVGMLLGLATTLAALVPEDGWNLDEMAAPPPPADVEPRSDDVVVTSRRTISVYELHTGDCFDTGRMAEMQTVDLLPCDEPHDAQVYAIEELPTDAVDRTAVTDVALARAAEEVCMSAAAAATGLRNELDVYYLHPTAESWRLGDHEVVCTATAPQGKLTAPLSPPQRT
jgi:uncharacterized RDD family membrane protein YckC